MLEANFCLLGKVALDSPPPHFFFFFLLVVAKHFLVRPASAGMLYGLRSVSRPVTGIEIVTPVWWGGGGAERAAVIIALVQQRQGLRRLLELRTRGRGSILHCCLPPEGKCL